MTELVEVEEVVADNQGKTTKFGGSEREGEGETPNTCCQVKHAARIFFGNAIAKLLAVVLRSEFRL